MQSTAARKFHGNASTRTSTTGTGCGETTKPPRSSLEVWQETMERISLQYNSKTFLEDGKPNNGKIHDQERFGKIVGVDTLLATAKVTAAKARPVQINPLPAFFQGAVILFDRILSSVNKVWIHWMYQSVWYSRVRVCAAGWRSHNCPLLPTLGDVSEQCARGATTDQV